MDISPKSLIKVVAVDNYPVITKGIFSFLLTEQRLFAVHTASNVRDSLIIVKKWRPHIIIIDSNLWNKKCVESFKQAYSGAKVIVFIEHNANQNKCHDIYNGARGLLLKNCSQSEMIESVLSVYADNIYISEGLAPSWEGVCCPSSLIDSEKILTPLTSREREVLHLISDGFSNKQIAAQLGIKNRTVEFHISNILSKLGASTRTQAVSIYLREGSLVMNDSH